MKRLFYLTILFFISSLAITAQNATIKGVIRDEKETIPGVNVTVDVNGVKKGAQTDLDGIYSLEVPPGKQTVSFSYTGKRTQTLVKDFVAGDVITYDLKLEDQENIMKQEVVISASKYEKKAAEETVSIQTISPKLLEGNNSTTADKALNKTPGVSVVDGQANIRGGSGYSYGAGSRVMLLVDDMPVLTGDAGFPSWSFIPVENLSQIEIIKGAASALYGSSALNGIINVRTAYPTKEPVTKVSLFSTVYGNPPDNKLTVLTTDLNATLDDGTNILFGAGDKVNKDGVTVVKSDNGEILDVKNGTKVKIGNKSYTYDRGLFYNENDTLANSRDTIQKAWWGKQYPTESGFSFGHRQKFEQFDLVLSGYFYSQDSWRQGEFDRRGRLTANTRYRFANKPGLSIGVNLNGQLGTSANFFIWNGDGADMYKSWVNIDNPINKGTKLTVDPFIEYFQAANGFRLKLMGRYYLNHNKNNTNQSTLSDSYYGEAQAQKRWEDIQLAITAGVVGKWNLVDAELYGDEKFKDQNYAAYVQADKKFFDKLSVAFGLRGEMNQFKGKTEQRIVPRIGLNYEVIKDITYIRASYGQGYRYPTIAEKFAKTNLGEVKVKVGGGSVPVRIGVFQNSNLTSETGWSAELGIKQGFRIGGEEGWKGFIDLAGFINEYQNMMEFSFTAPATLAEILDPKVGIGFQSQNVGDTRIYGADLTVAGKGDLFGLPTTALIGYTYINPKFVNFDSLTNSRSSADYNILKYRFNHTIKTDIETVIKKVVLGVSLEYTSFMEAIDQAFERVEIDTHSGLGVFSETVIPDLEKYRQVIDGRPIIQLDVRIGYNFTSKSNLALLVKNVLNREQALRPALIDAPRNYTIKFSHEF